MILRGFIKKELIQTIRDPRLGVMVLLAPVIQVLLFGFALTNDVINIRFGINAKPNDVVITDIYNAAIGSKYFIPTDVANMSPEKAVQTGIADVVLVAPKEGLTRMLERGEGKLQLLIDASNVLRARAIEAYVQGITHKVCYPEMKSPINVVIKTLYNPTLETSTFTIPGIMASLLMSLIMVLTCTAIAKEKESGTFETIISAPIKRQHILLGKTVPFAILGLFNVVVVLIAGIIFFDLPFRGNFVIFLFENILFVLCAIVWGILISTFVQNQQQAMLGCFIVIFIIMMLSGSFFPIDNMPPWLRLLAYSNPMSHHTFMVRNIILKGGDIFYILQRSLAMLASGIVVALYAFKRFKITLN